MRWGGGVSVRNLANFSLTCIALVRSVVNQRTRSSLIGSVTPFGMSALSGLFCALFE